MVERLRASRLAQNLRQSWEQAAPLLLQLAAAGLAALMAGIVLMDGLAPFGIALVAAAPPAALLAVSAGAVAGSAISLPFTVSGGYLAAVLAAAGVRFLLLRRRGKDEPGALAALAGATVLLVVRVFYAIKLAEGPIELMNTIPEGLLAIGMAMVFSLALPPLAAGSRLAGQPATVQGAAVLSAGAVLCALLANTPCCHKTSRHTAAPANRPMSRLRSARRLSLRRARLSDRAKSLPSSRSFSACSAQSAHILS